MLHQAIDPLDDARLASLEAKASLCLLKKLPHAESGFLGSGKTTLLKKLAHPAGRERHCSAGE